MTTLAWLALFSGLVHLYLASFIIHKGPRTLASRVFTIYCLSAVVLSVTGLAFRQAGNVDSAMFWLTLRGFWTVMPALFLHFMLLYTGKLKQQIVAVYVLIYAPALLIAASLISTGEMTEAVVRTARGWEEIRKPGTANTIAMMWVACLGMLAVTLAFWHYAKKRATVDHHQARLVAIAAAVPVLTNVAVHGILSSFNIHLDAIASLANMISAVLVGRAIVKHNLFSINLNAVAIDIITAISDAIFLVDNDGKIQITNPAALRLFGYQEEELRGRDINILFRTDSVVLTPDNRPSRDRPSLVLETKPVSKSGELLALSTSRSELATLDGKQMGTILVARDISEQKRIEAALLSSYKQLRETTDELIQIEKMSVLGELSASVAHELNQPLNSIKIICQSTLKYLMSTDKEEIATELKEIVVIIDKMAQIIDHMRVFSRRSEGESQDRLNINEVLQSALLFVKEQINQHDIDIIIIMDTHGDLKDVKGDPIRLEQVFLNLLNNARSALDDCDRADKEIGIRTAMTHGKNNHSGCMVVEIRDNGAGIPSELREKIFQPFFTTKARGKGTGLGLSIASRIVAEHNGKLELESEEGKGTLFRVQLPSMRPLE